MVEKIRSLVRPVVTILLVIAVIYFTGLKIMPIEAFIIIATAAIVWWYKDRSEEKEKK